MASLLAQPRTIVLQKPKKIFGSNLVKKDSNTPYSDATKVSLQTKYKIFFWKFNNNYHRGSTQATKINDFINLSSDEWAFSLNKIKLISETFRNIFF